jgi:hypothetical protein
MSDVKIIELTLASAVATGGTFTVGYPTGTSRGSFLKGKYHKILAQGALFTCPTDFTISFGASSATITYNGTTTLAAGAAVAVQLDIGGADLEGGAYENLAVGHVQQGQVVFVTLGSPATASSTAVCASQAITAAAGATINGASASGGIATFDVPRNVVAAWTGTAVVTVTGKDVYGNTIKESSASGTSLTGKKAFKSVTAVSTSADITGATVGNGDVLGLPVHLPNTAQILKELEDNAVATAGTAVAGLAVTTKSTATTADVRGTYDPNSACDGSKSFTLVLALEDPEFTGNPQYAG